MTDAPAVLSVRQAQSIRDATGPVNIWHGSIRSGKTLASTLAWVNYIRTAPPGRLPMIGKTLQTLERNVLDPLAAMFPDRLSGQVLTHTKGSSTALIFGREVDVLGANDARAESRIRGMTAAGAYVDEASLLPGEGYWSQLRGRMSVPGARLFATTNPDNPTHWLKEHVIDRAETLGHHVWHFTMADNPGLGSDYIAQQEAEHTGLFYKRNILGQWVLAEGAIYDQFDPSVGRQVIADQPDPAAVHRWVIAIDHGIKNPFVALLVAVLDDRLHVAAEWRWDSTKTQRQRTDGEYSTDLRTWIDAQRATLGAFTVDSILVDPAAQSFIEQLWRDRWPRVHNAVNDVRDGIAATSTLLGAGRLTIHVSCDGLIKELAGYVWDDAAAQRGEDKPVKVADHGPDAMRYAVMGLRREWRHWIVTMDAAAV